MESLNVRKKTLWRQLLTLLLCVLALLFLAPIAMILINSFKGSVFITVDPFSLPTGEMFTGMGNYVSGVEKINFWHAFGWSLFITVCSVAVIVLFSAMTGWYITRVKRVFTKVIYYAMVFSMVVPFQMVMFTMSKFANVLHLDNPYGIILIYLGFGSGLSTFMFSGFVKAIPIDIEEAAMIDGCGPIRTFFAIVFPVLRPTAITVAILNTMWIWNDYLLPTLLLDSRHRTIPIAVQYLKGGYGSIDMGAMMAVLIMAIIPIVVFYLSCQKHIIKGVVAGAVKG
ncbi:MAG: carbohydrate ABC transporter permease [Peptococcaceae bacterium]|jgi:raffinose/stachyose/melibiose transport system permease protein|nr:carbohydrate ABC transporter permease [Peptococcaceae bacterium]